MDLRAQGTSCVKLRSPAQSNIALLLIGQRPSTVLQPFALYFDFFDTNANFCREMSIPGFERGGQQQHTHFLVILEHYRDALSLPRRTH